MNAEKKTREIHKKFRYYNRNYVIICKSLRRAGTQIKRGNVATRTPRAPVLFVEFKKINFYLVESVYNIKNDKKKKRLKGLVAVGFFCVFLFFVQKLLFLISTIRGDNYLDFAGMRAIKRRSHIVNFCFNEIRNKCRERFPKMSNIILQSTKISI